MVSDDQVPYIENATTAAEMWNNLRLIYEAVGMQSMIAVHDKLSTIKYAGIQSGPLQTHIDTILGYATDLKRGNDGLTESKLLQLALKSLPETFTSLVQTISVIASPHTTLRTVTPMLLEEEVRQQGVLAAKLQEERALKAHTEKLALAKALEDDIAANAVKAYIATQRGSWRGRGGAVVLAVDVTAVPAVIGRRT
jgi:hypothetical protein